MLKTLKLAILAGALLFAAAQMIRPARTNPSFDVMRSVEANTQMTPEVAAILDRSCKDCHSNKTAWPWYSNVAPVSWFVIDHVNHGRKHLNFSDWAKYNPEETDYLLKDMCKTAKSGQMPLSSYTRMHHQAKLSESDIITLCNWTNAERKRLNMR